LFIFDFLPKKTMSDNGDNSDHGFDDVNLQEFNHEENNNEENNKEENNIEFDNNSVILGISPQENSLNMPSIKQSDVWLFFSKLSNDKVQCNKCKITYSDNSSTTTLRRHLKSKHSSVYDKTQQTTLQLNRFQPYSTT